MKHKVTLVVPTHTNVLTGSFEKVKEVCDRLVAVPVHGPSSSPSEIFSYLSKWFRFTAFQTPMYAITNYYPEINATIDSLRATNSYSIIHASSNFTMQYLARIPRGNLVLGPIDDYIEAARRNRMYARTFLQGTVWRLHERARKHYEPRIARRCLRVFFHSLDDLNRFSATVGGLKNARVIPHPVEPDDGACYEIGRGAQETIPGKLVFVGGLGSAFNVDAVLYFCDTIYPLIKKQVPDATFDIVGQNPPRQVLHLKRDPSITVTGTVSDVRPYIDRASVYVAPIRSGTGFKTKVVEALARGKAIVALPQGVQGLWDLGDGTIRIANDPKYFAGEVVSLLKNDTLRRELAFNARKLFEKSYTFAAVAPLVLKEYDDIEEDLRSHPDRPTAFPGRQYRPGC